MSALDTPRILPNGNFCFLKFDFGFVIFGFDIKSYSNISSIATGCKKYYDCYRVIMLLENKEPVELDYRKADISFKSFLLVLY